MQEKEPQKDVVLYNTETKNGSIFKDYYHSFLFKKTEKIVLGLYLVTEHLSDTIAIKNEIRDTAHLFLKDMIRVTTIAYAPRDIRAISMHLVTLTSLLELAQITQSISPKNTFLLKEEIAKILKDIEQTMRHRIDGHDLKKTSFIVDDVTDTAKTYKGHKRHVNTEMSFIKNENETKTKEPFIKDNRAEKIINLAKEKGTFTIKDISTLFVGVSEKTIQRELLKLVAEGVLKKEGERRWSTYSLL